MISSAASRPPQAPPEGRRRLRQQRKRTRRIPPRDASSQASPQPCRGTLTPRHLRLLTYELWHAASAISVGFLCLSLLFRRFSRPCRLSPAASPDSSVALFSNASFGLLPLAVSSTVFFSHRLPSLPSPSLRRRPHLLKAGRLIISCTVCSGPSSRSVLCHRHSQLSSSTSSPWPSLVTRPWASQP